MQYSYTNALVKKISNISFATFIKLVFLMLSLLWLYMSLGHKNVFSADFYRLFIDMSSSWHLWIVVFLLFINWGIEAYKWYLVANKVVGISYNDAFAGVLSGVSFGMLTPHGIGDYVGRILHVKSIRRVQTLGGILICRLSQLWITLLIGSVATLWHLNSIVSTNSSIKKWMVFQTLLMLNIALLIILFYHKKILKFFENKYTRPYLLVFRKTPNSLILNISFWSMLRYAVFVVQYAILLSFIGVSCGSVELLMGIAFVYLVKSIIPTFFDIGIREATAVYFFSPYSQQPQQILYASLLLWIINLVIPATVGTILFLRAKIN